MKKSLVRRLEILGDVLCAIGLLYLLIDPAQAIFFVLAPIGEILLAGLIVTGSYILEIEEL